MLKNAAKKTCCNMPKDKNYAENRKNQKLCLKMPKKTKIMRKKKEKKCKK
jgi:hypothetical protein